MKINANCCIHYTELYMAAANPICWNLMTWNYSTFVKSVMVQNNLGEMSFLKQCGGHIKNRPEDKDV